MSNLKRTNGRILVVVGLAWFFSVGLRFSLPALLPYIAVEFELSGLAAGGLMTVAFGAVAIGLVPGGLLTDSVGERNVLVMSMVTLTLGVAILLLPVHFGFVLGGVFLMSIGSGMLSPARFTIITDLFASREGAAHGVANAAGDVGNTLMPVVAGFLAAAYAWRIGVGYSLPFLVLIAVGLLLIVPERTSTTPPSGLVSRGMVQSLRQTFRKRSVGLTIAVFFLISLLYQSHVGMYPLYLTAEKGISETLAAVLLGVFFASSAGIHLLAGFLRDRFNPLLVAGILLPISSVGFVMLPAVSSTLTIAVLTLFTSAFVGIFTIMIPFLIDQLHADSRGTGFGIASMLFILPAAIGPVVLGQLADVGRFDLGIVFLGVLPPVTFVILVVQFRILR